MIELEAGAESTVICRPIGDLDLERSFLFRHVISDLLEPGVKIVIDLERVERVDAVGLSALVGAIRRVNAVAGEAWIVNAAPEVHRYARPVIEILAMSGQLTYVARPANGEEQSIDRCDQMFDARILDR